MKERRQYIRINKFLMVSYRVLEQFLGSGSLSRNISGGGICLPMHQSFKPGVILDLKIHLSELSKPISAIGETVWLKVKSDAHTPFELGIRFIEITQSDRNKIITYIGNKKPDGIRLLE